MQKNLFQDDTKGEANRDHWATPWDLYRALDSEFCFRFDLAAEDHTAKCVNYFTREDDAFQHDWHKLPQALFLNPPFSDINTWLLKCVEEWRRGAQIVALLPAHRCEQAWFHQLVIGKAREVRMIRRRVNYLAPSGLSSSGAAFPSMAVIYDPEFSGGETALGGM